MCVKFRKSRRHGSSPLLKNCIESMAGCLETVVETSVFVCQASTKSRETISGHNKDKKFQKIVRPVAYGLYCGSFYLGFFILLLHAARYERSQR